MANYELTLVLPGKSKSKEKTFTEKIQKIIESFKGKVSIVDVWGEIDLAYKIKKEITGYFLYFELELDKSDVKKLDDKLRMERDIIRYLLINSK